MMSAKATEFPIGASLDMDALEVDPYPTYERLRRLEPVSWAPALNLWQVVRHDDVSQILRDPETFVTGAWGVTGTSGSLILDTFGEQMLASEGPAHARHRSPFRGAFSAAAIRARLTAKVDQLAAGLIAGFPAEAELRSAFASRLPVLTMLALFGIEPGAEADVRRWYDAFERGLSNFGWDAGVRAAAQACRAEFEAMIQRRLDEARVWPGDDLLSELARAEGPDRLEDGEVRRNAAIIFFGGISTVEALILNTVYALATHPAALAAVTADRGQLPAAVAETMRWMSPVQSATRHVARAVTVRGVAFAPGDTVNCMLGAANRDPEVFEDPDTFRLDRQTARQDLGFAIGPHFCLGQHLARLEVGLAVGRLLDARPGLRLDLRRPPQILGLEFRQPTALHLLPEA